MAIQFEGELEYRLREAARRRGLGIEATIAALLSDAENEALSGPVRNDEREARLRREFEEAMRDPLFVEDMDETMHAFQQVDSETARMLGNDCSPHQWQVVLAELDPILGLEQAGDRPVLIISRESINVALTVVAVLPITSMRAGRRIHSSEVLLSAGTAGLRKESIVMAQQVRTISKERIIRSYCALDDESLREQIRNAMRVYLDLEG